MFMGTHHNKVDAKGRVSIPAPFRTVMKEADGRETVRLVLRPSHNYDCLEAWPEPAFKELAAPLKSLDRFSQEHDDLAAALFMDSHTLESDKEGRIGVPESLAARAGLKDLMTFMGLGEMFTIWEPATYEAFRAEQLARQKAQQQERRMRLPGVPQAAVRSASRDAGAAP
jgi:MraZ protein